MKRNKDLRHSKRKGCVAWHRMVMFIGTAIFVSSCGSLFPKPGESPQLGVLNPKIVLDKSMASLPYHLAIDIPSGGAAYDTSRIPFARDANSLDYIAGMEWTDRIPFLFQNIMVRSFENTGKVRGVARAASGINPDLLMMIDIRRFRVEKNDSAYVAVIELCLKLMNMDHHTIEDQLIIQESEPMVSLRLSDVVGAFNTAVGRLSERVIVWTLRDANLSNVPKIQK